MNVLTLVTKCFPLCREPDLQTHTPSHHYHMHFCREGGREGGRETKRVRVYWISREGETH